MSLERNLYMFLSMFESVSDAEAVRQVRVGCRSLARKLHKMLK